MSCIQRFIWERGNSVVRPFYGFDSFEGLPEDWRTEGDRKNFDRKGKLAPVHFPNIRLVKGWFNETIPKFKESVIDSIKNQKVAFLHIDCDIYSSTVDSRRLESRITGQSYFLTSSMTSAKIRKVYTQSIKITNIKLRIPLGPPSLRNEY